MAGGLPRHRTLVALLPAGRKAGGSGRRAADLAALAPAAAPLRVARNETAPEPLAAAADPRTLPAEPSLLQPFNGLQLAMDPRIPAELQAFEFQLAWRETPTQVLWVVNDEVVGSGDSLRWTWPLTRGTHRMQARLTDNAGGRFAIDGSTGVVTVADSTLLN